MASQQERIVVDQEALKVALAHVRAEKETAVDASNWEDAGEWRDEEKTLLQALGGAGLSL